MTAGTKRCLGCGDRGPWGSSGRCRDCLKAHKAKYTTTEYVIERQRFGALIEAGACLNCPRCGEPIERGATFDLGHQDDGTLRPEHPRCNRGARNTLTALDAFLIQRGFA